MKYNRNSVVDELNNYLNQISSAADEVENEVKKQIDLEADIYEQRLRDGVPERAGELKKSLKRENIDDGQNYGHRFVFKGEHSSGIKNEMLAGLLDHGTRRVRATWFQTKAKRELKGMSERILVRVKSKFGEVKGG